MKMKVKESNSKGKVSLFITAFFFLLILLFSHCFFNIYVNYYAVINEYIPLGGYNIYTLYDCFRALE